MRAWPDGGGFANEYEESRLKSIFGVVMVNEDSAANTKNHGAMTAHKRLESDFLLPSKEPLKQVRVVGAATLLSQVNMVEMAKNAINLTGTHLTLHGTRHPLRNSIVTKRVSAYRYFFFCLNI
jgi:hypothetical protein